MISFIVPAFNEEAVLARTLQAIHLAAKMAGQPYEVIVADDASTDGTAEVALRNGAKVVAAQCRQIAGTRNVGAGASSGDRLFFVDADTLIDERALHAALQAFDQGAVGGGCLARFYDAAPLYAHGLLLWMGFYMRLGGISSGAFMFCTRTAFDQVGGFDEKLYGGEDAAMSAALKRHGRFVVPWPRVDTSGRRVRAMSGLALLWSLLRMAFNPSGMLAKREAVKKIWYNPDRTERPAENAQWRRISNAAALVIVAALAAFPLWIIPWPAALENSPLGLLKAMAIVIINHVGLVLWPCSWYLARGLPKTPRWPERIKLIAVIALCVWLGWRSAHGVFTFWVGVMRWLGL